MFSQGYSDQWSDCLRIWEGLTFPIPEELVPFSTVLVFDSPNNNLNWSLTPCADDSHDASNFSFPMHEYSVSHTSHDFSVTQETPCIALMDTCVQTCTLLNQADQPVTMSAHKQQSVSVQSLVDFSLIIPLHIGNPQTDSFICQTSDLVHKSEKLPTDLSSQAVDPDIIPACKFDNNMGINPVTHSVTTENIKPDIHARNQEECTHADFNPHHVVQNANPSTCPFLNCALLNTWSMVKHATEISSFIVANELDLLFLTETWLSPHSGPSLSLAVPNGYAILSEDRLSAKGGGVAVIYRHSLDIHQICFDKPTNSDVIMIKLLVNPNTTYSFILVYRPPQKMPLFHEQLLASITEFLKPSSQVILLGDFNYWLHDREDPEAECLESALTNLGFTHLVSDPTHIKGHTLDWLCTHNLHISHVEISPCPWSDHFFICFHVIIPMRAPYRAPSSKTVISRNLKKLTKDPLACKLSSLSSDVLTCNTPAELANLYHDTLRKAVDSIAPLKTRKIKPSYNNHDWFNDKLLALRSEKNKALRIFRTSPTAELKLSYQERAKTYKSAVLSAKKTYYQDRISAATSNSREIFKILRELETPNTPPDVSVVKDAAWCESIQAALFSKIDSHKNNIAQKVSTLKPPSLPSSHPPMGHPSFGFSAVSESEVLAVITSLKPTTCQGDPCPSMTVKECAPCLVSVITKFINASFEAAVIPSDIKQAWITPLLKKPSLDPLIATNYRPITNVPFLLKIIDRIAYLQVQAFLESSQLFGSRQSGFRAAHSTETALIDLKATLLQNMDKGSLSLLMLLDLSAAFDLVDFTILTKRLTTTANFSQKAAEWIVSFLSDRQARVFSGSASATPVPLSCGVPQGSCLSPTLYNILTRPLFDLLDERGIPYTNYADDTQFVLTLSGDYAVDTENINAIYSLVQSWMAHNSLALNDSKTELLIVGTKQRLAKLPADYKGFNISGCFIPVAPKVKTLGVYLDASLSMKAQVNSVISSSSYYLKILRQLCPLLSTDCRAHIARAIISSKIDYCCSLLQNTASASIHKLQVLQNNAVRAVMGLNYRDHVSAARRELHWLPVKERVSFRTLTFAYKCLSGSAPVYLKARLIPKLHARSLRSSVNSGLTVPRFKLVTAGDRSFDATAPRLWNALPQHIREAPTLPTFKALLKTHLFT